MNLARWRLQELKHEEVCDSDSPGRDLYRYKRFGMGLIVSLILRLLPYRYRLPIVEFSTIVVRSIYHGRLRI
jgi:hypothetical protein